MGSRRLLIPRPGAQERGPSWNPGDHHGVDSAAGRRQNPAATVLGAFPLPPQGHSLPFSVLFCAPEGLTYSGGIRPDSLPSGFQGVQPVGGPGSRSEREKREAGVFISLASPMWGYHMLTACFSGIKGHRSHQPGSPHLHGSSVCSLLCPSVEVTAPQGIALPLVVSQHRPTPL